ncbi:MAG TPA: enoyl-CoA hydratase family protein [Nitriliruptorales bacterium]|nr:enoyl-CoA hydratase family protein [Nitriliruptorales bacterium]
MPFRASAPFTGEWRYFDLTVAEGVATVTFTRPERLNALTFEVYADLRDLLAELPERGDVEVLVITGRGRGFCSGGDVHAIIGELLEMDARRLLEFTRMTGAVLQRMREIPLPIVAGVNGIAAGAGAVIALGADLRVMARSASLQLLFTRVGLSGADMGIAYLLPRLVGLARATELLLLGDRLDAEEAGRLGLATQVVDDERLADAVGALARRLADGPTLAYGATKALLTREQDMSLSSAVELEAVTQALLMTSRDHAEFHAAYSEGREPRWEGR